MDLFTRREAYLGMLRKVVVNPSRTGFLCTDPEKVDHINFMSGKSSIHISTRALAADSGTHAI
jgi:hypothetical protein